MAIYKTISSKEVVRKVMRDLNPQGGDWLHDCIEWIGEALEHVGSSAQMETKVCTLEVKNHRAMLPADLYIINQVGTSEHRDAESLSSEISDLAEKASELTKVYKETRTDINSKIAKSADGTYTSNLTKGDVATYNKINKDSDHELREINSRLVVLENSLMGGADMQNVLPIKYCTSNFPKGMHCDNCSNEYASSQECYLVENDYIKTSFSTGRLCLGYKAIPTDPDCYPLVPDSVSFKEAMFWYIYKKMLLGGTVDVNKNGIQYPYADQQWKYYCTQARNEAVFPDIDRYESFMNQWVRLIPNINRHDLGFDALGEREDIYRGRYNTYGG